MAENLFTVDRALEVEEAIVTSRNEHAAEGTMPADLGEVCHEFRYDPEDTEPLSTALVRGIAATLDVAPDELDRPLQRTVDTDALDSLFQDRYDRSSEVSLLSFRTSGLDVVIRDGERVTIYDPEE